MTFNLPKVKQIRENWARLWRVQFSRENESLRKYFLMSSFKNILPVVSAKVKCFFYPFYGQCLHINLNNTFMVDYWLTTCVLCWELRLFDVIEGRFFLLSAALFPVCNNINTIRPNSALYVFILRYICVSSGCGSCLCQV